VFVIHLDVFLPVLRDIVLWENCGDGTRRLASATVNTFSRMDVKHRCRFEIRFIFFRVDTIDGTRIDTRSVSKNEIFVPMDGYGGQAKHYQNEGWGLILSDNRPATIPCHGD
jgi:hypothetical protein